MGPKLFIMYINHICKVSQVFKYILFADDTNLLCCDRDLNELVRVINGGLTTADMVFVNRLSRNISKTNYTIFGNRRITADICIVLKYGVNICYKYTLFSFITEKGYKINF